MAEPAAILDLIFDRASTHLTSPLIDDTGIVEKITIAYDTALDLLDAAHNRHIDAEDLLERLSVNS